MLDLYCNAALPAQEKPTLMASLIDEKIVGVIKDAQAKMVLIFESGYGIRISSSGQSRVGWPLVDAVIPQDVEETVAWKTAQIEEALNKLRDMTALSAKLAECKERVLL